MRVLIVEDSENEALLLLRAQARGYEPLYERVSTPEGMKRALEDASERGTGG